MLPRSCRYFSSLTRAPPSPLEHELLTIDAQANGFASTHESNLTPLTLQLLALVLLENTSELVDILQYIGLTTAQGL
ncbi:hypothetical protein MN608_04080 [Microdochium nivale]|nr:hypothetical protein MN608_04080 [Microdochium nivale]